MLFENSAWWLVRIIHNFKNTTCSSHPLPLDAAGHFQGQVNHNRTDDKYICLFLGARESQEITQVRFFYFEMFGHELQCTSPLLLTSPDNVPKVKFLLFLNIEKWICTAVHSFWIHLNYTQCINNYKKKEIITACISPTRCLGQFIVVPDGENNCDLYTF